MVLMCLLVYVWFNLNQAFSLFHVGLIKWGRLAMGNYTDLPPHHMPDTHSDNTSTTHPTANDTSTSYVVVNESHTDVPTRFRRQTMTKVIKPRWMALTFYEGRTASLQFDFCSIVPCLGKDRRYAWADKYLCVTTVNCRGDDYGCKCENWQFVMATTAHNDWSFNPRTDLKPRLSII